MRQFLNRSNRLNGFALVIVLITLFLGTIASASWIRSNTLNLRVTSGSNDYDIAYTAASLGLNYAEQWLTSSNSPFMPFNPNIDFPKYRKIGVHTFDKGVTIDQAINRNQVFSVSNQFVNSNGGKQFFPLVTPIPNVSSQPVFMVRLVRHSCVPPFEQALVRVTARGSGIDPNTTSQVSKLLLLNVKCDFSLSL